MAQNSGIEWTDTTWNPLAGCTRASVGCDNCYAAKMSLRLEAMALADIEAGKDPGGKSKYIGIALKNGRGIPVFNGTINLDEDELLRPYSWKKPRRVFVNSMSDLFHSGVPEWFILSAFNVMRDNPKHIFQVLTKRPERAADFTSRLPSVPRNVWIGTSVENQEQYDIRSKHLRLIPATVTFYSMEPLLAPVVMDDDDPVNWIITGGESGTGKRPFNPDWARSIRDQCQAAGVPFFMKQWDKIRPIPDDLMIRQFPQTELANA